MALSRAIGSGWAAPTGYGHDAAGRLTTLGHSPAGGGVTSHFGYNPPGQITSNTRDLQCWISDVPVLIHRSIEYVYRVDQEQSS